MKRILYSIIAIVALFPSVTMNAQARFGAVVGADISTLKFNQELFSVDKSVGPMLGLKMDLNIPGIGFGIDAALQYTQRGATLNLGEKPVWASDGYSNNRSYLHYIEVPLHVRYMYSKLNGIENTIAPYVFVGPSFSFCAAHNKLEALDYAGMALSMDFGIGAQLFKNWQVAASYDLGLTYAVKTKLLDDFSARNRTWKFTVTYYFK